MWFAKREENRMWKEMSDQQDRKERENTEKEGKRNDKDIREREVKARKEIRKF